MKKFKSILREILSSGLIVLILLIFPWPFKGEIVEKIWFRPTEPIPPYPQIEVTRGRLFEALDLHLKKSYDGYLERISSPLPIKDNKLSFIKIYIEISKKVEIKDAKKFSEDLAHEILQIVRRNCDFKEIFTSNEITMDSFDIVAGFNSSAFNQEVSYPNINCLIFLRESKCVYYFDPKSNKNIRLGLEII